MTEKLRLLRSKRDRDELTLRQYGYLNSDGERVRYNPTANDVKAGMVMRYNVNPIARRINSSLSVKDKPLRTVSPEFDILSLGGGNLLGKMFDRGIRAGIKTAAKGAIKTFGKKAASTAARTATNETKNVATRTIGKEFGDATTNLREKVLLSPTKKGSKKKYVPPTIRKGSIGGKDDLLAGARRSSKTRHKSNLSERRRNSRKTSNTSVKNTTSSNIASNVTNNSKEHKYSPSDANLISFNNDNPFSEGIVRRGVDNPNTTKIGRTMELSNGDQAYFPHTPKNQVAPKREIVVTKSGRFYDTKTGKYVSKKTDYMPEPSTEKSFAEEMGLNLSPERVYEGKEPGKIYYNLPNRPQLPNSPLRRTSENVSESPLDIHNIYPQVPNSPLKPKKPYEVPTITIGRSNNPVLQRYERMRSNSSNIWQRARQTTSNAWNKRKKYFAKRRAEQAAKKQQELYAQKNLAEREGRSGRFWRGKPKYDAEGNFIGRSKINGKNALRYGFPATVLAGAGVAGINNYIDRSPSYTPKSDINQGSKTRQIRQIADVPNSSQETVSAPRDTIMNIAPKDTTAVLEDSVINDTVQPQENSSNNSSESTTNNSNQQSNNTNASTNSNVNNATVRNARAAARQNRRSKMTNNYNSARRLKRAMTFEQVNDPNVEYINEADQRYQAAKNYLNSKENPSDEDIKFATEVSPELKEEIENENVVRRQEALDDMINRHEEELNKKYGMYKFGGRIYKIK